MTIKKAKAEAIAAAQPKKIYKSIKQLKLMPAKLVLQDEDGPMLGEDGLPITVTVLSAGTRQAALSTEALEQERAHAEELGENTLETKWIRNGKYIASVLQGWTHPEFFGAECSTEYAETLFSDHELNEIGEQILDYATKRENFIAK